MLWVIKRSLRSVFSRVVPWNIQMLERHAAVFLDQFILISWKEFWTERVNKSKVTYLWWYDKGKVLSRTGREGPEGEWKYSSTLSLTSVLDGGGWLTPRFSRFSPGNGPGTHCIGGLAGSRACLDGCEKSRLKPGFFMMVCRRKRAGIFGLQSSISNLWC